MDDTVACLVRGPASRYPRGYVWLFPIWFVILSAAIILVNVVVGGKKLPLWLDGTEIGALFLAVCTLASVLITARRMAFWADRQGVLLGSRRERKRPKFRQVYLPWSDIAQVRVVPRRNGALVELLLSPAAAPVYRPSLRSQASLLLGALIMPIGVGRGRPALTMPRLRPPAYRVKVYDKGNELSLALHELAPETVYVRLLANMAALRRATPRMPRPPRVPGPPRQPRRFGEYVPRRLPAVAKRR